MFPRISYIFCAFVILQIQATVPPIDINTALLNMSNHATSDTPKTNVTSNSTETVKHELPSNQSETVDKGTVNVPLVFPSHGFTQLATVVEKLPVSTEVPALIAKNVTTKQIVNATDSPQQVVSKETDKPSLPPLERTTKFVETTDWEVPDLLLAPTKKPSETDLLPVSPQITYNANQNPDKTVVLIDNGQNTEDELKSGRLRNQEPHVAMIQGQMAAILAGVFVSVSIVGYIALLSWRKYLERRYGNREMLVDEEFDDREDMKYFSI